MDTTMEKLTKAPLEALKKIPSGLTKVPSGLSKGISGLLALASNNEEGLLVIELKKERLQRLGLSLTPLHRVVRLADNSICKDKLEPFDKIIRVNGHTLEDGKQIRERNTANPSHGFWRAISRPHAPHNRSFCHPTPCSAVETPVNNGEVARAAH
jgi:hypothetical protein